MSDGVDKVAPAVFPLSPLTSTESTPSTTPTRPYATHRLRLLHLTAAGPCRRA